MHRWRDCPVPTHSNVSKAPATPAHTSSARSISSPFPWRHAAASRCRRATWGDAAEGGQAGEISATWHALPLIGLYGAYQWNRFTYDGTGIPENLADRGFSAGVRVAVLTWHP